MGLSFALFVADVCAFCHLSGHLVSPIFRKSFIAYGAVALDDVPVASCLPAVIHPKLPGVLLGWGRQNANSVSVKTQACLPKVIHQ
jgi:hypothetical protein